MSIYALSLALGGPTMAKSAEGAGDVPHETDNQARDGREMIFGFKNTSMSELALDLIFLTDRLVVDKTGLPGRYDFKLAWTPDEANAPTDGTAPPGLFTAIKEQLGLKIDSEKALADVVVIDTASKPTVN
jgi:uncharacterized protein (TIGR03435 family)